MKRWTMIVVMTVVLCGCACAQTFETGGIVGMEYDVKILKGWHANVEGDVRFNRNFTHYDRAKLGVGTDYTFWKKRIKIGAAYNYLNYHNRRDQLFENRHRVKGYLTVAPRFGSVKISYRAMVQSTFREKRNGPFKFNPKTYMRNRLTLTWYVPRQPVKLYVAEEFWWRLYKPGDNIIDRLRSTAGVVYDINKHHSLDFFLRFDHEVQVRNPEQFLCVGVRYAID